MRALGRSLVLAVLMFLMAPSGVGAVMIAYPDMWSVCVEIPPGWTVAMQDLCNAYYKDNKADAFVVFEEILNDAALDQNWQEEDEASLKIQAWLEPLLTDLDNLYAGCLQQAKAGDELPADLEKAFEKERNAITLAVSAYGYWAWAIVQASNHDVMLMDGFEKFDGKMVGVVEIAQQVKETYQFFEANKSKVAAWPDTELRSKLAEVSQMRYRILTLEKCLEHIKTRYEDMVEKLDIETLKKDLGSEAMPEMFGKLAEMGSDWEQIYTKVHPNTVILGQSLRDNYEMLSSTVEVAFEGGLFTDLEGMGAPFDKDDPVKAVEDMYKWYNSLIN